MSLETIKTVEDLSLNAWPSHQMQVYDGWILRFSYFYTHRTNCVETIGPAQLPLPEKVAYCEEVYEKWRTPCVFKISPLTTPALELYLAERGYEEQHRVDNMVLDLASFGDAPLPDPALPLITGDRVDDEWLEGLFELKDVTNADHRRVVPSMYAAIPKDEITVKVLDHEGHIAGLCGCLRDPRPGRLPPAGPRGGYRPHHPDGGREAGSFQGVPAGRVGERARAAALREARVHVRIRVLVPGQRDRLNLHLVEIYATTDIDIVIFL